MKAYDLFELSTRNLRESVLRNSLTTIGIAVGVASLVAMLALGVGLQQLAGNRLSRSGLFDTVVVTSRQDYRGVDRDEQRQEQQQGVNPAEARLLDDNARHELEQLPGVTEVSTDVRFSTTVRYNGKSQLTFVGGIPMSARSNDAFDEMKGSYFSGPAAEEAIVSMEFARELDKQNPQSALGKTLTLQYAQRQDALGEMGAETDANPEDQGFSVTRRQKDLKIVGLVEELPFGGLRAISRAGVFIPVEFAESLNVMQFSDLRSLTRTTPGQKNYLALYVRLDNPAQISATADKIKQMGFRTYSVLDATKSLRRFFAVLDVFLGIFGSLALAVASLAIVNTLVMAVLERRREIGVMKAIGASDIDIKKIFFVEAGSMGVAGGIAGVLLGWAIGQAINFGTNVYLRRQELPPETIWATPWWLIASAVAFSMIVSLLAGIYPASRAAKLDPIRALRHD